MQNKFIEEWSEDATIRIENMEWKSFDDDGKNRRKNSEPATYLRQRGFDWILDFRSNLRAAISSHVWERQYLFRSSKSLQQDVFQSLMQADNRPQNTFCFGKHLEALWQRELFSVRNPIQYGFRLLLQAVKFAFSRHHKSKWNRRSVAYTLRSIGPFSDGWRR